MAASKSINIIRGDNYVNFDSILNYLSTTVPGEYYISLTNSQLMEFKRILLLGEVYPYATVGFLPSPSNDKIAEINSYIVDYILSSNFQTKMAIIEYPYTGERWSDDLGKRVHKFIENKYENVSAATVAFHLGNIQNLVEMYIIDKSTALSASPIYGYYGHFFKIDTFKSGRPVSKMPFVGIPSVVELDIFEIDSIGIIHTNNISYVAVIRYAFGISLGSYFSEEGSRKYCGTFYYLELESPFLLNLGVYRTYRTKYATFTSLRKELTSEDIEKIFALDWLREQYEDCLKYDEYHPIEDELSPSSKLIYNWLDSMIDLEGTKFPYEEDQRIDSNFVKEIMDKFFIKGESILLKNGILNPETNTIKHTSGEEDYLEDLYAIEDIFDQSICFMSNYLGIDCIVLTHMPGKTRVVVEIMDSRERTISYNNIVRLSS